MIFSRLLTLGVLIIFLSTSMAGQESTEALSRDLFDAMLAGPVESVSSLSPDLEVSDANDIQDEFVRLELQSKIIGGYKVGFTSVEAQEKWGVTSPVSGVLFTEGKLQGKPVINMGEYQKLFIEIEVGFLLADEIAEPVDSIESLRGYLSHLVPVIELPDLRFKSLKTLTAADLVAANMASKKWLIGEPIALRDAPLQFEVTLHQEGKLLDSGLAVIEDRLEALLWLVNERLSRGWPLKPGYVLITGALGKINPASLGCYAADYGNFSGTILFEVTKSFEKKLNGASCLSEQ